MTTVMMVYDYFIYLFVEMLCYVCNLKGVHEEIDAFIKKNLSTTAQE